MPTKTSFEPITPTRRNFSELKSHLPPTPATVAQYKKRVGRAGKEFMQHNAYLVELEFVVQRMIAESWTSDGRAKHFNALKGIEQFVRQSMHYIDCFVDLNQRFPKSTRH